MQNDINLNFVLSSLQKVRDFISQGVTFSWATNLFLAHVNDFPGINVLNEFLFVNYPSMLEGCIGYCSRNKRQSCNQTLNKEKLLETSTKLLGIAPSAASQYLLRKRGYKIEYKGEKKELIEKLARNWLTIK